MQGRAYLRPPLHPKTGMSDIATLLKSEISRLSKKAVRQYIAPLQSASTAQRKQITALKKQVSDLQRQVQQLRRAAGTASRRAEAASDEQDVKFRFVAKGLRTLRSRLGLSAEEFGQLVGVSGQSVYNWESKKATPRATQVASIAALRGIGKKEARARLEKLSGEPAAE